MNSTRFVAEVSSNHHRDLDRCLAFVDSAADLGCAAVKFQQFRIRRLFAPEALRAEPRLLERRQWELPLSFNVDLSERARERGIFYGTTPFFLRAVELTEPYVDFFKIASYQVLWTDMLREVGRTQRPVVMATGMANMLEVGHAVEVLRNAGCSDLTLLHCVSSYPTPRSQTNLAAIRTLREGFDCPVGWSDHTVDEEIVNRAVKCFGAETVEFHLDLDAQGPEHHMGHCWLPAQVESLRALLESEHELPERHIGDGDGRKLPREVEMEERSWRTDPSDGLRPLLEERRRLRFRLVA